MKPPTRPVGRPPGSGKRPVGRPRRDTNPAIRELSSSRSPAASTSASSDASFVSSNSNVYASPRRSARFGDSSSDSASTQSSAVSSLVSAATAAVAKPPPRSRNSVSSDRMCRSIGRGSSNASSSAGADGGSSNKAENGATLNGLDSGEYREQLQCSFRLYALMTTRDNGERPLFMPFLPRTLVYLRNTAWTRPPENKWTEKPPRLVHRGPVRHGRDSRTQQQKTANLDALLSIIKERSKVVRMLKSERLPPYSFPLSTLAAYRNDGRPALLRDDHFRKFCKFHEHEDVVCEMRALPSRSPSSEQSSRAASVTIHTTTIVFSALRHNCLPGSRRAKVQVYLVDQKGARFEKAERLPSATFRMQLNESLANPIRIDLPPLINDMSPTKRYRIHFIIRVEISADKDSHSVDGRSLRGVPGRQRGADETPPKKRGRRSHEDDHVELVMFGARCLYFSGDEHTPGGFHNGNASVVLIEEDALELPADWTKSTKLVPTIETLSKKMHTNPFMQLAVVREAISDDSDDDVESGEGSSRDTVSVERDPVMPVEGFDEVRGNHLAARVCISSSVLDSLCGYHNDPSKPGYTNHRRTFEKKLRSTAAELCADPQILKRINRIVSLQFPETIHFHFSHADRRLKELEVDRRPPALRDSISRERNGNDKDLVTPHPRRTLQAIQNGGKRKSSVDDGNVNRTKRLRRQATDSPESMDLTMRSSSGEEGEGERSDSSGGGVKQKKEEDEEAWKNDVRTVSCVEPSRCFICQRAFPSLFALLLHMNTMYPRLSFRLQLDVDEVASDESSISVDVFLSPFFNSLPDSLIARQRIRDNDTHCGRLCDDGPYKLWQRPRPQWLVTHRLSRALRARVRQDNTLFAEIIRTPCTFNEVLHNESQSVDFRSGVRVYETVPTRHASYAQSSEFEVRQMIRLLNDYIDIDDKDLTFMAWWNYHQIKLGVVADVKNVYLQMRVFLQIYTEHLHACKMSIQWVSHVKTLQKQGRLDTVENMDLLVRYCTPGYNPLSDRRSAVRKIILDRAAEGYAEHKNKATPRHSIPRRFRRDPAHMSPKETEQLLKDMVSAMPPRDHYRQFVCHLSTELFGADELPECLQPPKWILNFRRTMWDVEEESEKKAGEQERNGNYKKKLNANETEDNEIKQEVKVELDYEEFDSFATPCASPKRSPKRKGK